MPNHLPDSRFAMWRAIVALIHADGVVTPHELAFISKYMANLTLSDTQRSIINSDIQHPEDIYKMYDLIENDEDRADFFSLARAICWCDGDFDAQEQKILKALEKRSLHHFKSNNNSEILEMPLNDEQWMVNYQHKADMFNFLKIFKA